MKAYLGEQVVDCEFSSGEWRYFNIEKYKWVPVKYGDLKLWPGQIEVFVFEQTFFYRLI